MLIQPKRVGASLLLASYAALASCGGAHDHDHDHDKEGAGEHTEEGHTEEGHVHTQSSSSTQRPDS